MSYWDKQPSSRFLLNQQLVWQGGTASVVSTNFSQQTYQIRFCSTIAGYLSIGDSTAGTLTSSGGAGMIVPASTVGGEYFSVTPGQICSFWSTSTSTATAANISVTEMT